MLSKKNIVIVCAVVVTIVGAVWVFSLTGSGRPTPSEPAATSSATPSATPGPDGKAFTEAFLDRFGNFDGNRELYVGSITPLLTPDYSRAFFAGPGAVDSRIRRTSKIIEVRRVSGSPGREVYRARLQTKNTVVGQEPYEDELVLQVFLTLQDGLWKVSNIQFGLGNG